MSGPGSHGCFVESAMRSQPSRQRHLHSNDECHPESPGPPDRQPIQSRGVTDRCKEKPDKIRGYCKSISMKNQISQSREKKTEHINIEQKEIPLDRPKLPACTMIFSTLVQFVKLSFCSIASFSFLSSPVSVVDVRGREEPCLARCPLGFPADFCKFPTSNYILLLR